MLPPDATFPTLQEYLDQSGVLVTGTEAEIQAKRKEYRKRYKTHHKRLQRMENREVGVLLSREKEYVRIEAAAKKHSQSIPAFLKAATLAYLDKTYLVPDRAVIYRLAAVLGDCLNDVRKLTQVKGKHSFFIEEQYRAIETRIVQLEDDITTALAEPPDIEKAVADAIRRDPALRLRLLHLLTSQPDLPAQ